MKSTKIAIIGCGNLGLSILKGLLEDKTINASNITITKRRTESLQKFAKLGVSVTSDNVKAIQGSELIVVALKPYTILDVLAECKSAFSVEKHTLVSLATGITLSQLQKTIELELPTFRAMPNTAADVKESVTCICANKVGENKTEAITSFFNSIGTTISIDEPLMESATVLGACGIAYVLRFIRGMIQAGIEIGFDAKTASQIVNQTVKGASELLIERKQHPEFEIDKVTTPKGCTIVGLNEMEHNGFSSALIKGVVASFEKIEK